jgi:hypothetical protein
MQRLVSGNLLFKKGQKLGRKKTNSEKYETKEATAEKHMAIQISEGTTSCCSS